jgi:hypothetical protein
MSPRPLALVLLALGCGGTHHGTCPDRNDDLETQEEVAMTAKGKDACARASDRLASFSPPCKESRPDFADICRELVKKGQPICPTKLARITSCAEVDKVCR